MQNSEYAGSHINLDKSMNNLYEILILTTFTFLTMDQNNKLHHELHNQHLKVNIFNGMEAFLTKNAPKMS